MSRVLGVEAGGGLEVDRHFGDWVCLLNCFVMICWLVMKVRCCTQYCVVCVKLWWCDALSVYEAEDQR